MNLQEKLDNIKYQLASLEAISSEIKDEGQTEAGREKIKSILERHDIFESFWDGPGCFYRAMSEIYREHAPGFSLPRFQQDSYGIDAIYTQDHDYLLLKVTTSKYYGIAFIGFRHLFDLHKKHTKEHTPETTYEFAMKCVDYMRLAARKMMTLPIFNADQLIFLSLMQHYYTDCDIEVCPSLDYIIDRDIFGDRIGDDFKRMVFETNGANPLSVRGSLPVITHYARKKALGHYEWADSDPSSLIEGMRSNKALNLRKAFDKMESYLGSSTASVRKRIDFDCIVGVETEVYDNYPDLRKLYGIGDKPSTFFSNRLRFGLFGSCRDPRSVTFRETYIGWIEFDGEDIVYDRFEDMFNYLEDDIVGTLEDNYNFLLEKLPTLGGRYLRNTMLEYITEGQ